MIFFQLLVFTPINYVKLSSLQGRLNNVLTDITIIDDKEAVPAGKICMCVERSVKYSNVEIPLLGSCNISSHNCMCERIAWYPQ